MADTDDVQGVGNDDDAGMTPLEDAYAITPEDQAAIDAIKRRNMRFAIIFGIILLVLGFFAGRYAKQNKEDSLPDFSTSVVVCELSNEGAVCL